MSQAALLRIEAGMLLKTAGTQYDGLGLDGRPPQGASPFPFLTLRELARRLYEAAEELSRPAFQARPGSPARSEARTDEFGPRRFGLPPGLDHQRGSSTADESQIRDSGPNQTTPPGEGSY